jgi:hypothetical protein
LGASALNIKTEPIWRPIATLSTTVMQVHTRFMFDSSQLSFINLITHFGANLINGAMKMSHRGRLELENSSFKRDVARIKDNHETLNALERKLNQYLDTPTMGR